MKHEQIRKRLDPLLARRPPGLVSHNRKHHVTMRLPQLIVVHIDHQRLGSIMPALRSYATHAYTQCDTVTAEHVRGEVKKMSEAVTVHWERLRIILDRHAESIYKRWAKKTKSQRIVVLLAAWPHMSAIHRPDYAAFRKEVNRPQESGARTRAAYLWPHINLEDLAKPQILPLFMDSRSHNKPFVFANADHDSVCLALATRTVVPVMLTGYKITLSTHHSSDSYGKLVAWDKDHDFLPWTVSRIALSPGHGLIVLEVQQRIYHFLVACCEHIMHDIVTEHLGTDLYAVRTLPVLSQQTVNGFDSLAIMVAEAHYRAPASLDLSGLETLLAARLAAAEDHLWALKEDPGYFAEVVFDIGMHNSQVIKDESGSQAEPPWENVAEVVIQWACMGLEMWHSLHSQVRNAHALQAKHQADISVDAHLPEEYLQALLISNHHLDYASKIPLAQLNILVFAAPSLRSCFVRTNSGKEGTELQYSWKHNIARSHVESDLLGLLMALCGNGSDLAFAGFDVVLEQLEQLIQTEPTAKSMISGPLAGRLEDIAIIAEASRQLRMYQPWAAMFKEQWTDRQDAIADILAPYNLLMRDLHKIMRDVNHVILLSGDLNPKRFCYPIGKRRTRENTQALRNAESRLDALWLAIERSMNRKGSRIGETAIGKFLAKPKVLLRTPEWKEPVRSNDSKANGVEALNIPLSELYFDLEHRTEGGVYHTEPPANKQKTKTRGSGSQTVEADTIQPEVVHTQNVQPMLQVDARALRVFRTMFHTPALDATPGQVAWTDFLHAMVATGFVPSKLYGSVWQFQPTKLGVERSIQFHEPHPSPKLAYHEARRVGRRLARAYGWAGGMFELAKKTK